MKKPRDTGDDLRKKLKLRNGQRSRYIATVSRFGMKNGYKGQLPTVLLVNVKDFDTHENVCDHLWFTKGKSWDAFNVGDTLAFDARVSVYTKGYMGYRDDVFDAPICNDYRLERPTKLVLIESKHDEL